MAALHTSCQLIKLFWTLLWLQRIIYWTVKLVKPSQKLQCKAVTSMILLKILYRNAILKEHTGHLGPTSLVRTLSFPTSDDWQKQEDFLLPCRKFSYLLWWCASIKHFCDGRVTCICALSTQRYTVHQGGGTGENGLRAWLVNLCVYGT